MSESNDSFEVVSKFEAWYDDPSGTRLRGRYKATEKALAWEAWKAATKRCLDIAGRYQAPAGSSAAGELAHYWTMDALRQIREEIAGVLDNRPILNKDPPDDRA